MSRSIQVRLEDDAGGAHIHTDAKKEETNLIVRHDKVGIVADCQAIAVRTLLPPPMLDSLATAERL